ncbi:MAG: hypothetical protein IJY71_01195 [Clostridia bacterium]|nr:hypothetical protein [Clostridia bacterium]
MRKRVVILTLCALFLCTGFLSIGYAALTDELTLDGSASVSPGSYVYISSVSLSSGSASNIGYSGTVLASTVTLTNSASSKVVLSVTLKNNSPFAYKFNGLTYTAGSGYDNTAITATLSGISKGTELAAGASKTVTVTFAYGNGVSTNKTLNSLVDISFVLASEYVAVDNSLERFEEILNDADTLAKLDAAMSNASERYNDTSYIGNVAGATDADSSALNEIFTVDGDNKLQLEVDGKTVDVTAIIKNEDIGGTADNEMVIYMTGSEITGNWFRPGSIQVFAAIYRKNAEGKWAMIGQLYEGTANSNNYTGQIFGTHNSFNTDTWKSSYVYHGVAEGATINQIVAAIPE